MITQSKIDKAVQLLQKAEKLALEYSEDGFYLAFSGGKDSQCIYHLAKLAGVKFKAYYHNTTIDHPLLLKFIKQNYKDVTWVQPKMTFFQICRKEGILPSPVARFCCKILKEGGGEGMVTITGVRRSESSKRSLRNSVEISGHKFSGSIDQFNQAFHADDNGYQHQCIKGKDKIIINPIIDWTDNEVWSFIRDYLKIPYCNLYDKGYHRLGCLLCPMASLSEKNKMLNDYPGVKRGYIKLINDIKEKRKETFGIWGEPAETILDWWIHKTPIKRYLAELKQQKLDL